MYVVYKTNKLDNCYLLNPSNIYNKNRAMNAACVVYIWLDPVACGWQQCSCILSVPACTIRTLRNVDRQGIWGRWIDLLLLNRRPQQRGIDIHSCTVRVMLYTYTVILRLVFVSCYSYYTNYTTCVWVRVRVELECVCVCQKMTSHSICCVRFVDFNYVGIGSMNVLDGLERMWALL